MHNYPVPGPSGGYGPPQPMDFTGQRFGLMAAPAMGVPTLQIQPIVFQLGTPYGPIPGYPDALRGYAPAGHQLQLPGSDLMFPHKDAGAALADRLNEQLQLGQSRQGREYTGAGGRGRGQFYEQRDSGMQAPDYGAGSSYYGGQQRGQQGTSRGGRSGGRGGAAPQEGRTGQPKPRKQQKGLEDNVKRTVYISYIDLQVTEEQLATFFSECGNVLDCRICGDPNSAMRFAFIEFQDIDGAQKALTRTGSILGTSPLRVLPSKTAIVPVNKEYMPKSHDDIERCSRTVYVANIDKKMDRNDVRNFFEQLCGKINKIRLLGDYAHSTRIAFIEFVHAEAAMAALNCSGALLGECCWG
mmetsp:Transcript_35130/g.78183  ORF Transcript_35130/g.78183 Transcript_35130/m.78183 type:complete len:355 (+) Transcript_35130:165-1229(+)